MNLIFGAKWIPENASVHPVLLDLSVTNVLTVISSHQMDVNVSDHLRHRGMGGGGMGEGYFARLVQYSGMCHFGKI